LTPGREDWLGTWKAPESRFGEIQELGRNNPIVNVVLNMMHYQSLPMVQALELMVIELAKQNAMLQETLVQKARRETAVILLAPLPAESYCKANGCHRWKGDGAPACGKGCFAVRP
jgi:hypothetical protein